MQNPKDILQHFWGYPDFKHPQEEIIASVLAGNDTLAILPTGGGKSLCYQIPALIFKGITLVVSPLIALMQDQVNQLKERNIGAELMTSQLSREEIDEVMENCFSGKVKLLYVAPERLQSRSFIQFIRNLEISLIAVDEAHCISQWGHDFRPAYLKINSVRELFPKSIILALTATATPKVRSDISESLAFRKPKIFISSLKRENLIYRVLKSQNEMDDLVYELTKNPGPSIVFCRTRKQTFEIATFLKEKGLNSSYFHARLPADEKIIRQKEWTESNSQIMVSTNAFGMGINKPDVRNVIHLDLPHSLEAYVQEAGRAGRDGKFSQAVLFLQPFAVEEAEQIFKSGLPDRKEFDFIERMFYNYFEIGENERPENPKEFRFGEFINKFKLNKKKTERVLAFLDQKEVISIQKSYSRSSIQILVNPKNINYSKSIQSEIIETLMRRHSGITNSMQNINEFAVAFELNKSVKKVKENLNKLADAGYIEYLRGDSRLVYFNRPRETNYIKNNLWKEFEANQILQWKKLQDLIYYASQDEVCREKLILRYFGEKPQKKCGQCDICKTETIEIEDKLLLQFLSDSPKTVREILIHFVSLSRNSVLDKLQELTDEGLVEYTGIDTFKAKSK